MTLREQIEALPSTGTTDEWDLDGIHRNSENVERQAVLDIIERWVNDELPKIIESAVDEALDNLKQDAIWAEERNDPA